MFAKLRKCRGTQGPDLGIEALRPGLEVWRLRSQALAVRERSENPLSGASFPSSKEDSIPSYLWAESQTRQEVLAETSFLLAMAPEALQPVKALTLPGKVKVTSTLLFPLFCSSRES